MRLVFMGSPALALPSLEAVVRSGDCLAVFTQPPRPAGRGMGVRESPVGARARELGLPIHSPASAKGPEFLRPFQDARPDLAVVVAYGLILPPAALAVPGLGCVNVHASLLPELRGAAPIQWAIARGLSRTGVTLMQMDAGMDTGPILLQRETPLLPGDDAVTLGERLSLLGARLLEEGIPALERGGLPLRPQEETRATFAPPLRKEDGRLDWSRDAAELERRVRAFVPWPGAYTDFKGRRLGVTSARVLPHGGGNPGRVALVSAQGIEVETGRGRLVLLRIRPEGKKELTPGEFASGYRVAPGDRMGESA